MNPEHDVIIIGAGPAGTAAAAIIAGAGNRVLVLEREKFPRYHIGESLIPFTYGPLERLGMIPKMRESCFVKKFSVSFVQPDGRRSVPFYFHTRYDINTIAQTWQVRRAEFDLMLLDNARENGAEVREQTRVTRLLKNDSGHVIGVEAETAGGRRGSSSPASSLTPRARRPSPPIARAGASAILI